MWELDHQIISVVQNFLDTQAQVDLLWCLWRIHVDPKAETDAGSSLYSLST